MFLLEIGHTLGGARRAQNGLCVIFGCRIGRYARLGRSCVILLVSALSTGAILVLIAVLFKGGSGIVLVIMRL